MISIVIKSNYVSNSLWSYSMMFDDSMCLSFSFLRLLFPNRRGTEESFRDTSSTYSAFMHHGDKGYLYSEVMKQRKR